jgi:glyoxalase family protein
MLGIHHVTAIAGNPVKNLSFYSRDRGLRFVKKTSTNLPPTTSITVTRPVIPAPS